MVYILKYVNNSNVVAYELDNKCVRKLSDTLFLVKIKRNMTIPAWFQSQKRIFRVKNAKKWWLCEKVAEENEIVLLEYYQGNEYEKGAYGYYD